MRDSNKTIKDIGILRRSNEISILCGGQLLYLGGYYLYEEFDPDIFRMLILSNLLTKYLQNSMLCIGKYPFHVLL